MPEPVSKARQSWLNWAEKKFGRDPAAVEAAFDAAMTAALEGASLEDAMARGEAAGVQARRPGSLNSFSAGRTALASNTEPRCPCLLLLDNSMSMKGRPIQELNEGVSLLIDDIRNDALAAKRVELGVLTFGGAPQIVSDFTTVDTFRPPHLAPNGNTPMGAAIELGLQLIDNRLQSYRMAGVPNYKPWLFLITDGAPTDEYSNARNLLLTQQSTKRLTFFAFGVEGADMNVLKSMATTITPLKLSSVNFKDLFIWLSSSLKATSSGRPGESRDLPPITFRVET